MGRCWREFLLPLYLRLGLGRLLKHDPAMPDEAITLEYLADNVWLTGSPQTLTRRINHLQEQTGGFGYLIITSYDAASERPAWQRSLQLFATQVLPACTTSAHRHHAFAGGRA